MAITFSRDYTGAYIMTDSTTGETRRYPDQRSWLRASLVELLKGAERMEQGIDRLLALHVRSPRVETT